MPERSCPAIGCYVGVGFLSREIVKVSAARLKVYFVKQNPRKNRAIPPYVIREIATIYNYWLLAAKRFVHI